MKKNIRFGEYNILSLYQHVYRADKSYPLEKEHSLRLGNARAINEIDPDFQILLEVEDVYAVRDFTRDYLGNRYKTLLLEGNDSARVNIALLVKQSLPVEVEWRSYKYFRNRVFSRDLPVGIVYERDADGIRGERPKFALLATHYKSQRKSASADDFGEGLRARQVDATLAIIRNLQSAYGEDLDFVLIGDLNSDIHSSPEFNKLFEFGFKDTLDGRNLTKEERATHTYLTGSSRPPKLNQLDGILYMSPRGRINVISAAKVPDRDANGKILGIPQTREDRDSRPSDHNALGAELEFN